jgi:hypothetical protein
MLSYFSNIVRSEGDPKIVRSGRSSLGTLDRVAKALGWFSIGLGVAEMIAPGAIARALGMRGKEGLIRAYGAREIGAGALCLSIDKKAGLWSRAAGDGLDLATLLPAMSDRNPQRGNVALALTMVLGITVLDVLTAQAATMRHSRRRGEQRLYHDRTGFPKGLSAARGAAKEVRLAPQMNGQSRVAAPAG